MQYKYVEYMNGMKKQATYEHYKQEIRKSYANIQAASPCSDAREAAAAVAAAPTEVMLSDLEEYSS